MIKPEHYLIAGGVVSILISILHFILALKPALYRHISASQESSLAQMAEQGSASTTIATVALAMIFAIWATYAFSGAGLINPLPLLRTALIAIGVIYILRGFVHSHRVKHGIEPRVSVSVRGLLDNLTCGGSALPDRDF